MAERGKYCFRLFITTKMRDILLGIVCEFQSFYSFTANPRKLNSVTRLTMVLFIIQRYHEHITLLDFCLYVSKTHNSNEDIYVYYCLPGVNLSLWINDSRNCAERIPLLCYSEDD